MTLGIEQGIANYLSLNLTGTPGLYDDADPANRIIFIQEQPPVPTDENPVAADGWLTTALEAITVFTDGGEPPLLQLGETHTITIQVRNQLYEPAMQRQREIFELLQMNGGTSNGANPNSGPQSEFLGIPIYLITADFPPLRLGRDRDGQDGRYRTTQSFTVRTKTFTFV